MTHKENPKEWKSKCCNAKLVPHIKDDLCEECGMRYEKGFTEYNKVKEIAITFEDADLIMDMIANKPYDFTKVFWDKEGRLKCIDTEEGKKYGAVWLRFRNLVERGNLENSITKKL